MGIEQDLATELEQALVAPLHALGLERDAASVARQLPALAAHLAAALLSQSETAAAAAGARLALLTQPGRAVEWWASPLGRVLAAHTDAELSPTDAARWIGLTRVRIYQLLDLGRIVRGPGGGVSLRSLARFVAG